ncbi:MAG: type IV secretory system conjugative DNA transfer family protein [Pleurocapsa sp. SU_196_0]|nr:type IV secretory system conjugative DNA transfer family protein [Pleurocapsa sp. SU_196_0]
MVAVGVNLGAHLVRLFGIAVPAQVAAYQYFSSGGKLDAPSLATYAGAATVMGLSQWYGASRAPKYTPEYTAHWASKQELEPMCLSLEDLQSGIALGFGYKRITGIKPGLANRKELGHALIVGPGRRGKGLHLMSTLFNWQGSAVVVDIKGEMYDKTSEARRRMDQNIIVLDPSGYGSRIDPFAELQTNEGLRAACNLILKPELAGANAAFPRRASSLLFAMMRAALVQGVPVLPFVRDLTALGMREACTNLEAVDDPYVQQDLVDFLNERPSMVNWATASSDKFLNNSWSNLTGALKPLMSDGILAMTSGRDLTALDLVTKPTTVYLRFSESDLKYTAEAFQIVVMSLINNLLRQFDADPNAGRIPCLFCFDEAGRIEVPGLPGLVSTVAGRGLSALIYIQSISQLVTTYGAAGASTIRDNCDAKVFFTPNDIETARYISELCGRLGVQDFRYSRSSENVGAGESHGVKDRDLITTEGVMSLKLGRIIAKYADYPPMVMHRLEPWLLPGGKAALKLQAQPLEKRVITPPPMRRGEVNGDAADPKLRDALLRDLNKDAEPPSLPNEQTPDAPGKPNDDEEMDQE